MSVVFRVFWFLNAISLTFVLIYPLLERAMAWDEAMFAIFGFLFMSIVWGLLAVLVVPKKAKGDAFQAASHRRRWGIIIGALGFVYCVGVGPMVAISCQESYEENSSRSYGGGYGGYGSGGYGGYGGYGGGSDFLSQAYARQDRYGRDIGWIVTASSILPFVLLVVSLVRKPKAAATGAAAMAVGYGQPGMAPPQGYPPQGYPPQGQPPQGGGYGYPPPGGGGYPPPGGGYGGPPPGGAPQG
jgi:hypothetical protein